MPQGKIIQRGPHSFITSVSLGRDPVTGARRRPWISGRTRADVKHKVAELRALVARGAWTPPVRERFGPYLTRWLDESRGRLAASTFHGYQNVVRQANEAPIGGIALRDLRPEHLERYYGTKIERGLSPNAVRNHHRVLRTALQRARKHGLIGENPATLCDLPPATPFEPAILDTEHLRLFLGEAKRTSPFYPLYLAAATTGLRQSELLGARWQDLGSDGILQVRQAFLRVSGKQIWKGPKTKRSRRPVVIPAAVLTVLGDVGAEQAQQRVLLGEAYEDHDLIFAQANGKPHHAQNIVNRDMKPLLRRAGLPESFRFHGFRHSHLSHLERLGVGISVAQERAGHSAQQMTLHYTHPGDGQRDAAALVADDLGLRP